LSEVHRLAKFEVISLLEMNEKIIGEYSDYCLAKTWLLISWISCFYRFTC